MMVHLMTESERWQAKKQTGDSQTGDSVSFLFALLGTLTYKLWSRQMELPRKQKTKAGSQKILWHGVWWECGTAKTRDKVSTEDSVNRRGDDSVKQCKYTCSISNTSEVNWKHNFDCIIWELSVWRGEKSMLAELKCAVMKGNMAVWYIRCATGSKWRCEDNISDHCNDTIKAII